MRSILAAMIFLFSGLAFAGSDKCVKYNSSERYTAAIRAVADYTMYDFKELCTLDSVWDVEAQPSRVVLRNGDVIPHVAVQLHREYDSCLYMVRDSDLAITSARCYSGW